MKTIVSILAAFSFSLSATAQMLPVKPEMKVTKDTVEPLVRHSILASATVGFGNDYRSSYTVPSGFEKNNTSGFLPVYVRAEYVTGKHIGIGATFVYNNFYGNYYQLYSSNGKIFKRYKTDQVEIYSGGLALNYHFGKIIPVKKLDVFVTAGFLANTIHHSALPQGDSVVALTDRTVTPVLRVGARYYIANASSFYLDAGYDKHSLLSVGYSCRFIKK